MIRINKATEMNLNDIMAIRMKMLKEVNDLNDNYEFGDSFKEDTENYIKTGNQTTYLAYDDGVVGCATICYYEVMPTYDHPSGKRAHIMNIFTQKEYRKQGLASTLLYMLIDDAKEKGVTEITLDATEEGKKLYYQNGFIQSNERMVLDLNKMLKQNIKRAEQTGCQTHGCGCGER